MTAKCHTCKKKATFINGYVGMCHKHKGELLCEIILIMSMLKPKKKLNTIVKEVVDKTYKIGK